MEREGERIRQRGREGIMRRGMGRRSGMGVYDKAMGRGQIRSQRMWMSRGGGRGGRG